MYIQELLVVASIHLLALMSPGPDLIMVLRNTLMYSRKTGIWSALGLACGIVVHVTYCLFGIAVIISKSIIIFSIIKYAGSAYLIYIGIQTLRSRPKESDVQKIKEVEEDLFWLKAIRLGFLTNVANPKATLFFLAFFTQIISPETPLYIQAGYGAMMVVMTFLWFSFVTFALSIPIIKKRFDAMRVWVNYTFGVLLVGIGIKVALSD